MMGLGLPELAIILLIVVVIFGARKLPELGRGLGSGMREFKAGVTGQEEQQPSAIDQPAQTAPPVQPPAAVPVAEPVAPAQPPVAQPVQPPAPAPAPEPQQPQRPQE